MVKKPSFVLMPVEWLARTYSFYWLDGHCERSYRQWQNGLELIIVFACCRRKMGKPTELSSSLRQDVDSALVRRWTSLGDRLKSFNSAR